MQYFFRIDENTVLNRRELTFSLTLQLKAV